MLKELADTSDAFYVLSNAEAKVSTPLCDLTFGLGHMDMGSIFDDASVLHSIDW